MNHIVSWWKSHGTKILGTTTSVLAGAIVIPDLIPLHMRPYAEFANLLLGIATVKRGFTNTRNTP